VEIIAKTVIVRRGTRKETEMVQVTATETGIVAMAKDTAKEAVTAEMTDAIATGIVDQGITTRSIRDAKTTAAESTGNAMMNMAEEIAKIQEGAGVEEEGTQVHLREGPQRQRDAFPYLNASAKHRAGMFMHQATNSIRPCKLSKLVYSTFLVRIERKSLLFLELRVSLPPSLYKRLAWASVVTQTCLANLGACTLAASLRK